MRNLINGVLMVIVLLIGFIEYRITNLLFSGRSSRTLIVWFVGFVILIIILLCAVTFETVKPTTKEGLKSVYKDVSWISRRVLMVLSVFTILFMVLGYYCCAPIDYQKQFPDAEKYLTEHGNFSDGDLITISLLPQWFVSSVYAKADGVQKAIDVKEDTTLNDEEREDALDIIADQMNTAIGSSRIDMFLCLFLFYLAGVMHVISIRCMHYHSEMRKLD